MNSQRWPTLGIATLQLIACSFCAATLCFLGLSMRLAIEDDALVSQPGNPPVETATFQAALRSPPPPTAPVLTATPTQLAALAPPTAWLAPVRPARTSVSTCIDNAAFVADVTIPDGTVLASGQLFYKIWRVLNTSTCTWKGGYTFAFVGGERMGASATVAVPVTAPGAFVDLRVPMVAPMTDGVHSGYWRLRSPSGAYFGATPYVTINVIALVQTPTQTATITPVATPIPTASDTAGAPFCSSVRVVSLQ